MPPALEVRSPDTQAATEGLGVAAVHSAPAQLLSRVRLSVTPWPAARQASLSITNSQHLLKLVSIESVMLSSHLHPLSSPSPPAHNPSQHQGLFQ